MNLSDWAASVGVSKHTAYKWFRDGTLPVPAQRVGRLILVDVPAVPVRPERVVVYCRVSSHDQQSDLERQVGRVTSWATANGYVVSEVVTEVGSALNGARPKFRRLLSDPSATVVVAEHRDRFARFGVEYVEAAMAAQGRRLVIVDDEEPVDDFVRDVTDVLTSLCARLYGRRSARNRAEAAMARAAQGTEA